MLGHHHCETTATTNTANASHVANTTKVANAANIANTALYDFKLAVVAGVWAELQTSGTIVFNAHILNLDFQYYLQQC